METNRTKKTAQPSKRKADVAFGQQRKEPSNHQQVDKKPSGKVVNFQDDDSDTVSAPKPSESDNITPNPGHKSNVGRLKKRAADLFKARQSLPIYSHAREITSKLASHDVLLLVGETGSGKSTQIPQFLLDQSFTRRRASPSGTGNVGGCIAITQPRRVAAISLARRVAEEMGTPVGSSSPASQVGYSVRFDTSVGPNTRVKFLTDGMLLQELLRDPWLKEYSVVVVDEVHERGVNVDLVMGFLKRIVEAKGKGDGRGGVALKVVVMSATADMERIESFFAAEQGEEKEDGVNGDGGVGDGDVFNGFSGDEEEQTAKSNDRLSAVRSHQIKITSCFIKGRQYPVTINYSPQPVASSWDAAMERIMQIHQHTPLPGDVLVFLPGQEGIDSLESLCNSYANTLFQQSKQKGALKVPKLLILPLFAALPTAAQQRVFEPTPPFTRKIILSTNIAETSVTVPGIRHVIDTGKRKARFFRPSLNLDTLLTKPISRSSAKQRAGRAGREAPGSCWRLYTEKTFYELEADTEPEILRCDLSQLVLSLKAHDIDDILTFPLLTQPPAKALERALLHLLHLKALDPKNGTITPLGRDMCSLPLPANLARIILASLQPQYNCLAEIIDIVSGLSVENIWLPSHTNRANPTAPLPDQGDGNGDDDDDTTTNPIELARRTLYRRSGDHLTLLAAMQAYTSEPSDRKEWCRRHGISHRAMSAAMDVRKQLTKLVGTGGRYNRTRTTTAPSSQSENDDVDTRVLKTLLTGLHTNTAHLVSNALPQATTNSNATAVSGPYRTYYTSKPLHIHPSSVLFARERERRPADVVFSEFVYTSRPYARCVSAVEGRWIEEVMREVGAEEM